MEIANLNGRSLYVGGAEGIDALAESLGKQHDMQVHVILYPQHERARFVTPLSPSQIQEGFNHVYKANETLCRSMDTNVLSLGCLQRNPLSGSYKMLKQILLSVLLKTEVLLISITRRNRLETGWSVQMALDAQNKILYVYDESNKQWYTASWIKRKDNSGKWYTWGKFTPL